MSVQCTCQMYMPCGLHPIDNFAGTPEFAQTTGITPKEAQTFTIGTTLQRAAYESLIIGAFKPLNYEPFFPRTPAKPLTRRQKIERFFRRVKHKSAQFLHDKAVKWGAYCDSDY